MNKKAEAFKSYLEEHEYTNNFQVNEVQDDNLNTVVFRSNITVEGQQLPTFVVLDDTAFSLIHIQISPQCRTEENELAVLKIANDMNQKFKPFKLYFDQVGSLMLDICLLAPGDDYSQLGAEVYGMFEIVIDYLNNNYRPIMKEIW